MTLPRDARLDSYIKALEYIFSNHKCPPTARCLEFTDPHGVEPPLCLRTATYLVSVNTLRGFALFCDHHAVTSPVKHRLTWPAHSAFYVINMQDMARWGLLGRL
jgi:hypothetical protein